MKGHHVERRFGWDTHGLPIEHEIDKKLGITGKQAVMEMGIEKYNAECRSIVMRYREEWRHTVERIGRWIDFDNDYKVRSGDLRSDGLELTVDRRWTRPSWSPSGGPSSNSTTRGWYTKVTGSCRTLQP